MAEMRASSPVVIQTMVVTNPVTSAAQAPVAEKRFQKKERRMTGEKEQPIPA